METIETKIQLLNEICTQLISANNSLLESLRIESALREDLEKRVETLERATPDKLIRVKDAAKLLCVSLSTIYEVVKAGKLTPYYVGDSGYMKFWLSEVKSVAEARNGT